MRCTLRAGVEVTLVDANHCPGAVQFLFQLPDGGPRYVHCGDMRFCAALKDDPHLRRFVGARAVFLDTTYCNPRFTFPLQVRDDYALPLPGRLAALSTTCAAARLVPPCCRMTHRWPGFKHA